MIPLPPHRTKSCPTLGAASPGLPGPYGIGWAEDEPEGEAAPAEPDVLGERAPD